MRAARRSPRAICAAVFGCLILLGACGDDGDSTADASGDVAATDGGGSGGADCSLVDAATLEELYGRDLSPDLVEGFEGSELCNFNAADDATVLVSRIAIDGETRYDEAVAALSDPVPVDVGDEAVATVADRDFGGSVDLHARSGDVYVTVSVTFPPGESGDAVLSASTELAELVL